MEHLWLSRQERAWAPDSVGPEWGGGVTLKFLAGKGTFHQPWSSANHILKDTQNKQTNKILIDIQKTLKDFLNLIFIVPEDA